MPFKKWVIGLSFVCDQFGLRVHLSAAGAIRWLIRRGALRNPSGAEAHLHQLLSVSVCRAPRDSLRASRFVRQQKLDFGLSWQCNLCRCQPLNFSAAQRHFWRWSPLAMGACVWFNYRAPVRLKRERRTFDAREIVPRRPPFCQQQIRRRRFHFQPPT
jgi:hypothetical protein